MQIRSMLFAAVVAVPLTWASSAEAICQLPCSDICTSGSQCNKICSQNACNDSTCGQYGVCGGGGGCFARVDPSPAPEAQAVSKDGELAAGKLQAVVFYEGARRAESSASLAIGFRRPDGSTGWVTLEGLAGGTTTAHYDLKGAVPTGEFLVNGVATDGGGQGLAFGLLWRDASGSYHLLKSNTSLLLPNASYVGLGKVRPDASLRDDQRALLLGAKLIPVNGQFTIPVL